jgi:hypothetical protein
MSLKEFVDQGGVIILREPKDLQNVVLGAKKVGYPVKKQYTCNGQYPFFFSVKDAKVLTSEDVKDRPLNMDVKDFLSMIDVITSTVKADEGETVYVQCENQKDFDACLKYFERSTGLRLNICRFLPELPFFNLQNGYPYPAHCLEPGHSIISFDEFREKFLRREKEEKVKTTARIFELIDLVTKSMKELEAYMKDQYHV